MMKQRRLKYEEKIFFTCKTLKFSKTLFLRFFSGNCFSLFIKVTMYSHMGEFSNLYTQRPELSQQPCSISTFSTTWLPNEHTLVEQLMVICSGLSNLFREEKQLKSNRYFFLFIIFRLIKKTPGTTTPVKNIPFFAKII